MLQLLNLASLLAACCEGQCRISEEITQNIFTLNELVRLVNINDVCCQLDDLLSSVTFVLPLYLELVLSFLEMILLVTICRTGLICIVGV